MAQEIHKAEDWLGSSLVKTARVFPWFGEVHIRIGPDARRFSPGNTSVEVRCLSWADGRCLARKGHEAELLADMGGVVARFLAPFLAERVSAVSKVAQVAGDGSFLEMLLTPACAGVTGREALELALFKARERATEAASGHSGQRGALVPGHEEDHQGTAINQQGDRHDQTADLPGDDSGHGAREGG